MRGPVRELAVETGSGDVSVRAPATLTAEVEIETASGGIETDFELQVTRHSRDHVVGQIGTQPHLNAVQQRGRRPTRCCGRLILGDWRMDSRAAEIG